jgi:hypothetical protein
LIKDVVSDAIVVQWRVRVKITFLLVIGDPGSKDFKKETFLKLETCFYADFAINATLRLVYRSVLSRLQ